MILVLHQWCDCVYCDVRMLCCPCAVQCQVMQSIRGCPLSLSLSLSLSLKLIDLFIPETYNYLLGDSILVAPVLSDPSDVSVTFSKGQWVAWWNETLVYKQGDVATFRALPLEVFPAFIKASMLWSLELFMFDCTLPCVER